MLSNSGWLTIKHTCVDLPGWLTIKHACVGLPGWLTIKHVCVGLPGCVTSFPLWLQVIWLTWELGVFCILELADTSMASATLICHILTRRCQICDVFTPPPVLPPRCYEGIVLCDCSKDKVICMLLNCSLRVVPARSNLAGSEIVSTTLLLSSNAISDNHITRFPQPLNLGLHV